MIIEFDGFTRTDLVFALEWRLTILLETLECRLGLGFALLLVLALGFAFPALRRFM